MSIAANDPNETGASPPSKPSPFRLRRASTMRCLADLLERSGGYKVLSRPCLDIPITPIPDPPGHGIALLANAQTTGLGVATDDIVQLALLPFSHDDDETVIAIHEPLEQLRDPGRSIPAEVSRRTGIDDAAVRGKAFDVEAILRLLSKGWLLVAHDAAFARPALERLVPAFADLPWACGMMDVPWAEEGITSLALEVLTSRAGFYFDARGGASDGCLAAVELLRRPLPISGRIAMSELLRNARVETYRIVAEHAPHERRDALEARGYVRRPAAEGMAWSIEVPAERIDVELTFLGEVVYGRRVDLPVIRIDAHARYSGRV